MNVSAPLARSPQDISGLLALFDDLLAFGNTRGIGFLFRHGDRQQEIDRHAESAGDFLVQRDGAFALSAFELRQVALGDAEGCDQLGLRHTAPFAQSPDGILSSRQPIDNSLGQKNFVAGCKRGTRTTHNPGSASILIEGQRCESLIFTLRENRELLAPGGLDELNLGHDVLLVVDFAAMADGSNDKRPSFNVEDDAPVPDPQPRAGIALETLHIALPGLRERPKLVIKPPTHVRRQTAPLTCSSGSKDDLHAGNITECDIYVKEYIAYCDIEVQQ